MSALAKALAAVDFGPGIAELERLRADLANCTAKQTEVQAAAERAAEDVRNFAGPEPDLITDAILSGKPLPEVTRTTPSRTDLEAHRNALFGSLDLLRRRADDLRLAINEVEHRERIRLVNAARPYLAQVAERQVAAAEAMLEAHAAIEAICLACRVSHLTEARNSAKAVRDFVGADRLLPYRAKVPVPQEVAKAFEQISATAAALGCHVTAEISIPS